MELILCLLLSVITAGILAFPSELYQIDDSLSHNGSSVLNRAKRNSSSDVRESCGEDDVSPKIRINTSDQLKRLRFRMKASNFQAYIVPSEDEHQSEFVEDHDKRRQYISGFSGSAGTAVILQDVAALWTDGRYYLQAEKELDCNWILMKRSTTGTPQIHNWLIQKLKPGDVVGANPKLTSYKKWNFLKYQLAQANVSLPDTTGDLIDDIWTIGQGRPPQSAEHIFVHEINYTGLYHIHKVKQLRGLLKTKNVDGMIISALDEIAWLFNLRGSLSPYYPVFKAYAFISQDKQKLYVNPLKITSDVKLYLRSRGCNDSDCVKIGNYNDAFEDLKTMVSEVSKVLILSNANSALVNLVPEKQRVFDDDPSPIAVLKSVKNPVEIEGMKHACLKDTVAIVDFAAMLEEEVRKGKHWDEFKAAKTLMKYRKEQALNRGESFAAVSAFGPNGAIVHYQPKLSSSRYITDKGLYLLDSGGQYLDGTVDITRTFHFGTPSVFEREVYTRVLMGVIDLMRAIFPAGVKDIDLDIVARLPLYEIGLDYPHGTGHGIGHYLSVHEGPLWIGKPSTNTKGFALKPGMMMSNEPGYYENGKFGIRLETLMMVVEAKTPHQFDDRQYYAFEPICFVPFEPKLINFTLLTTKQKAWLNWYNSKTRESLVSEMKKQNRERGLEWLYSRTAYYLPLTIDDLNNAGSFVHNGLCPAFFIPVLIFIAYIL